MRLYKDMSFKKEISEVTGVSINTALGENALHAIIKS